jgi:hypothetical protein
MNPLSLASDPVMMAKYELVEKKIPMVLRRTWPTGRVENIPVNELEVDVSLLDLKI